jgi:hypothetical protein
LEVVRAAYGMCELIAPDFVSVRLLGEAPDGRARAVVRILGARHLVQAALTAHAGRTGRRLGGSVDAVHAASMLVLAALDGSHRRSAAANAALALAFAAGEFA